MKTSYFQNRKIRRLNWIKLFFFISLIVVFTFLLIKIHNMFLSALLAVVLSQILRPIVDRVEDLLGWKRVWTTFFVFVMVGGAVSSFLIWAMPFVFQQLQNFRQEIPNYISGLISFVGSAEEKFYSFLPFLDRVDLTQPMQKWLLGRASQVVQDIPTALSNSFSVFFLCSFLSFFMLKDSHKLYRGFLALVPNHVFETTLSLTHHIGQQLGRFIRVRMFEALIVGLITGVGLQIISFPFALIIGLFAGVMNLIPYLGPFISVVPAVLICLANNMSFLEISMVLSVFILAQIIDNVVLIPIFVARMMKMHPVAVLVVVIAGAQFLGILGMIISIPVANAIQVAYHGVYKHIVDSEVK